MMSSHWLSEITTAQGISGTNTIVAKAVLPSCNRSTINSVGYATVSLTTVLVLREVGMTANDYKPAEVLSVGSAQDLIRGAIKGVIFDDSPSQERRVIIVEDVE